MMAGNMISLELRTSRGIILTIKVDGKGNNYNWTSNGYCKRKHMMPYRNKPSFEGPKAYIYLGHS